jgi:hypothetical protein
MRKAISISAVIAVGLTAMCLSAAGFVQSEMLQKHLTALKESLARNQKELKQYEWTENTVVLLNGEEKSNKQYLCRYAPDGSVQKTIVEASPDKQGRGLRGRIMEKKKEELTGYMRRAMDLVKLYIPPSAEKIQAARDAGNASVTIEPGRHVRLTFRNYQLPDDSLSIDLDPSNQRMLGATVSTYIDDPADAVGLIIQFGVLPDGVTYPAAVNLNVKSKNLTVQTTNSNYRKLTSGG